MFKRSAISCAFVVLVQAAAFAQGGGLEGPPPGQEGPPPSQQDRPTQPQERPSKPQNQPPRADAPGGANRCGSVAYTADGAFGASYGLDNCEEAERLAIGECERESTDKADCSRGAITRRDSWFYVQFCRQGSEWTTHVTNHQTFSGVNQEAADWARRSRYGAGNCRLVPNGLLHSGGLHTKM